MSKNPNSLTIKSNQIKTHNAAENENLRSRAGPGALMQSTIEKKSKVFFYLDRNREMFLLQPRYKKSQN